MYSVVFKSAFAGIAVPVGTNVVYILSSNVVAIVIFAEPSKSALPDTLPVILIFRAVDSLDAADALSALPCKAPMNLGAVISTDDVNLFALPHILITSVFVPFTDSLNVK